MCSYQPTLDAEFVSLHVRVTNRAAFTLYRHVLGFEIHDVEKGYYADKEDAYDMRKEFKANSKVNAKGKKKKLEDGKISMNADGDVTEEPKEGAEGAEEGAASDNEDPSDGKQGGTQQFAESNVKETVDNPATCGKASKNKKKKK